MYRLTEQQLRERRKKQEESEKKKGKSYSEKSKILSGLNIYVTNIPWEWVPMKQVHELNSLRWQIEIVFKTWRSLSHCQTRKNSVPFIRETDCIFLCSSTMFKMR
ncbi:transposase [Bacillus cereus group sp. FL70]|uniref:transposase n=1 Tax=Bacillus cereus group sp. FL70 TaxID=3040254 RepID=UPI0033907E41